MLWPLSNDGSARILFLFSSIRTLGGFPQLEDSISKDESKHKNIKLADIMRGKPAQSGWHKDMICFNACFSQKPPKISIIALGDHAKVHLATFFQVKKPLYL